MHTYTTASEIAELITRSSALGCGHLVHLLRPTMMGEMNLLLPLRDTVMPPLYRMGKAGKPVVVLVGDDDYRAAGPDGWACAAKLRSWATFALVHGSAADDQHYAAAAMLAQVHRRLVFVETTSAAAHRWAEFLRV